MSLQQQGTEDYDLTLNGAPTSSYFECSLPSFQCRFEGRATFEWRGLSDQQQESLEPLRGLVCSGAERFSAPAEWSHHTLPTMINVNPSETKSPMQVTVSACTHCEGTHPVIFPPPRLPCQGGTSAV